MSIREDLDEMAQALLAEHERSKQYSDYWLCMAREAVRVSSGQFARELRSRFGPPALPTYWPK